MTAGAPEHFDVIVVGSGFGGSVSAARLSEAGLSVCVLERGKAYPPGSFPRSPLGMKQNFWDPSEGLHGLFDMWEFDGLDAVCASGLGGGSLIYANVFLRKDEHWFVTDDRSGGAYEDWPVTRADLDPHYAEVERRVGIQHYPLTQPPYDQTRKVIEYRDAAQRLGLDWNLVPLAVTFANDGSPAVPGEPIPEARPNLHGRARQTCRLCGECDVGCNYGSKNTLDYTYLSDAKRAGAEMRIRCEVRAFEPREGGGYRVDYVRHEDAAEGQPTDTNGLQRRALTCDRLILAAGTLGTTWLMLRNRSALPGVTAALGQGFSGNGDLLSFAAKATRIVDGERVPRIIDPGRGPVITSAIRVADALDGGDGRGFYLEDAGYPEFANWVLEAMQAPGAVIGAVPRAWHVVMAALRGHRESEMGGMVSAFLGRCDLSSGMLPLLGMGRDMPDGNMTIKDERLEVDWSKHGASSVYFDRVNDLSRRIATELGADFMDNPIWHANRVITVHSLGGCRMGRSEGEGVVDSYGRVFGHPGLYIADGSVMPGPVGANPSLTIAALADRFATAILDEPRTAAAGQAAVPPPPAASPADPAPEPQETTVSDASSPPSEAVSLSFSEEMQGYVNFGETDFDRGFRAGKKARTAFMVHLTITAADVDRFTADPNHTADAAGWIESNAFGGKLPVTRGVFNLFVDQHCEPPEKRMLYRLEFADGEGHPLTVTGFKTVIHGHALDLWGETTTLFTRVLAGHVAAGEDASARVVATGIINIHPLDFAHQLTTFRVHPAHRLDALGHFGELFAGSLWSTYGSGAKS